MLTTITATIKLPAAKIKGQHIDTSVPYRNPNSNPNAKTCP